MTLKRAFIALIAFTLMLPLSGCGCHRHCCGDNNRSFAPPPGACCPPAGPAVPGP
ncbi:MAG: hypothetical protein J0I06_15695 [Planctomycetes bacterium]|nr:hypothetical protein [Planctomycetota bacterium]